MFWAARQKDKVTTKGEKSGLAQQNSKLEDEVLEERV